MSKEEIQNQFDPNGPGIRGNLFGFPFTPQTSELIIIPVPWEVTVSYHTGTAQGPSAILKASSQIDSFVKEIEDAWKLGVCMLPVPEDLLTESTRVRELAHKQIRRMENGGQLVSDDPLLVKIKQPDHLNP